MIEVTKKLFISLTRSIQTGSSKTIIGLSRSILAMGVLLKLLFNSIDFLIPYGQLHVFDTHSLRYRCNFFLIFNTHYLIVMQILAIIILVMVITGYYLKITSLLHFWISASFFMFRSHTIGADRIDMLLTLLLIPVCFFDDRKNHWHHPVPTNKFNALIQDTFLLFIKLQVAFIYFDSFHKKLFVEKWLNATVLYYWFTHNYFGLHPLLLNILHPILTTIPILLLLSWSALAFEALLAIAFVFPSRFKLLLLKCGIIFHFSILLIHGFSALFFVMSAALFLYLYPPGKSFPLIFNEK